MKELIANVNSELVYLAVDYSTNSRITVGTMYCKIQRSSDNLFWSGMTWGAETALPMTHKFEGVWVYSWVPDAEGYYRVVFYDSANHAVPLYCEIYVYPNKRLDRSVWTDVKASYLDAAISSRLSSDGINELFGLIKQIYGV